VIQWVVSSLLCVTAALVSILVFSFYAMQKSKGLGSGQALLIGTAGFVVLINFAFGALSLLPVASPLNVLALPVHLVLVAGMSFRLGYSGFKNGLAYLMHSAIQACKGLPRAWYLVIIVFSGLLVLFAFQGVFTVPGGVDELSYHVPQAVGIIQEGRARSFSALPSWIYYYPQGAASVWAWTMLFTGSDEMFRLVQMGFGLQLLLATGLLARRMGANAVSVVLSVVTVIAMPIFYVLATTIGADLGYAAAIMSFLVFLAPPRQARSDEGDRADLFAACLFLAQAVLFKIPVVALVFFMIAGIAFAVGRFDASSRSKFFSKQFLSPLGFGILLTLAFSFHVYALNWIATGNPMFPLTLRVAGIEIFKGDLQPIEDIVMGHSTFGNVSEMKFFKRWHAVFADWFQPMNQDAFGGAGPIFLLATLFMAVLGLAEKLRRPNAWIIAVAVILVVMVAIPASHLPRYSLAWLCLLSVLAAITYTDLNRQFASLPYLVIFVVIASLSPQVKQWNNTFTWTKQMSSPEAWYSNRGRAILEKLDLDRQLAPTGNMLAEIRNNVMSHDILAYSVRSHAALMWNRDYSNKVKFVEVMSNLKMEPMLVNRKELDLWVASVRATNPDWVLVYTVSGLATGLRNTGDSFSYEEFYADPIRGDSPNDRWNMTLLRKIQAKK
jgi:hypothetical protein